MSTLHTLRRRHVVLCVIASLFAVAFLFLAFGPTPVGAVMANREQTDAAREFLIANLTAAGAASVCATTFVFLAFASGERLRDAEQLHARVDADAEVSAMAEVAALRAGAH